MIVFAGDEGVGKSMLCYSLAMALASGRQFLGKQLTADRVLYFDAENSDVHSIPYQKRVWLGLGCPDTRVLDANLVMYQFDRTVQFEGLMAREAVKVQPVLIIIDTANSACAIDDENDNAKGSAAIAALKRVKQAAARPDCVMLILKHAKVTHHDTGGKKKGGISRDIRGAKIWKGECDGIIIHTATQGRPRHGHYRDTFLWPTKNRAFGLEQPIHIKPVTLGDGVRFDGFPVLDKSRSEHDE